MVLNLVLQSHNTIPDGSHVVMTTPSAHAAHEIRSDPIQSEGYKAGKLMCDGQTNLSSEAVHLFCLDIEQLVKVRLKPQTSKSLTNFTINATHP